MEQTQPSRKKKIIINTALLFMLVIFPAMSWIYLNSGANFYRGMMADLGNYGEMPDFSLENSNGDTITQEVFNKKLSLVNFGSAQDEDIVSGGMKYVYDQFKESNDVFFLTVNSGQADSISFGNDMLKKGIDPNQWSFLYGDSATVSSLKKNHFVMPDSLVNLVGDLDRAMVLVDTNNVIRNYVLETDSIQLNRLITIMSVLMPRGEKASIKFEREKEK